jgi:alkylation response protein AidB-like acyl-CoA dehydrogenase
MDFVLSDDQRMLSDAVQGMLQDTCPRSALRAMAERHEYFDANRWARIVEMGLPGVAAPADSGGLGLGEIELMLVAEASGQVLLPEPLVEHAGVAVPLLAALAPDSAELKAAVSGKMLIAVADPLDGRVRGAHGADALLLPHEGSLHLVPKAEVRLKVRPAFDELHPLYEVEWTPATRTQLAAADVAVSAWREALYRGALLAAAQCLGIAQSAISLAVEYAKVREQFGKAIGTNQAVKHLIADQQVRLSFARPVVLAAAMDFAARDSVSWSRASHAKLAAATAAERASRMAIQIFGAMGFSWEADVHFFLKRSLSLKLAWGGPAFHREWVASHVLDGPIGAENTFSRAEAR